MADKYSYKLTEKAHSDLNVLFYIEQKLFNVKAAKDFAIKLFDKIENIREFPQAGAIVDNEFITDKSARKFQIGKYTVFYKPEIETETIIILRIIYGARNIDEILTKL